MEDRHWTMKAGFAIGAALIAVGMVMQLLIGAVVWSVLRWPVNGVALVLLLTLIGVVYVLRTRVYAFRFIGTYRAAVPALVYAVALTIVEGLDGMRTHWAFVLIYVYLDIILGQVVIRQVAKSQKPIATSPFLLHLGLFLALTAAALGNGDVQKLRMITVKGVPEWQALDEHNKIVEMPFAIELQAFTMETYPDGKPKRYASDIIIHNPPFTLHPSPFTSVTVEVNKPAEVDGWKIYQYDYDTRMGARSEMSVLELVRDPWLPMVYAGIYLMLAGAVLMLLRALPWKRGWHEARRHPRRAVGIALLIAVAFFCVHHFMPILHSDQLVPALQSPWFKPHIIAYMLAYTMMASATVIALYQLIKPSSLRSSSARLLPKGRKNLPPSTLVYIGLALMTIGMLFGALWAKEAWGHYWAWDPKETWAAITWLSYLVFVHYTKIPTHKPKLALWVVLISFVMLQMCWWGIKLLPQVQQASMHLYK